ncbi:MAG: TlpA family protein disulfide reductase [bacterium]|nr:TlpA family protein disulfide reductase [bacterium]
MNQRQLAAISVAVLVVLVVVGVLYVRLHPSQQLQNASVAPVNATAEMGQRAPEFVTASTNGLFDLDKTTKPAFIEIFATWCPHCQRETAVIEKLYTRFGNRVAFIAIPGSDTGMDGTSPESQLDVLTFQNRFGVSYPIGAYDPSLSIAKQYLKGGFPTIAIVDAHKTIAYINSGEIPYEELAAVLERTLK